MRTISPLNLHLTSQVFRLQSAELEKPMYDITYHNNENFRSFSCSKNDELSSPSQKRKEKEKEKEKRKKKSVRNNQNELCRCALNISTALN